MRVLLKLGFLILAFIFRKALEYNTIRIKNLKKLIIDIQYFKYFLLKFLIDIPLFLFENSKVPWAKNSLVFGKALKYHFSIQIKNPKNRYSLF